MIPASMKQIAQQVGIGVVEGRTVEIGAMVPLGGNTVAELHGRTVPLGWFEGKIVPLGWFEGRRVPLE